MPQAMSPSAVDDVPSKSALKSDSSKTTELEVRNPPLPHITQSFIPLSLLIRRLVQHSHNKLGELVDSLQGGGQSDEEKKLRIIEHMQDTRKQFIKVLVLAMWCKNAAAVSEVIDLKLFLDGRLEIFHHVVWNLFDVRRKMSQARVRNPDLDTAVQVLSTGHASTSMTRRYVPPPPLTSSTILKTLSNINTLLSLRLALHSPPPPHFRTYTIHSGRATFTVEHEFEIDMSIGSEDPTSQLYLIDFRLLFHPCINAPLPLALRKEIEGRGDAVLKSRGLDGIFEFLHEFVLTHKINVLLWQAKEMLTGRWTENLRVQQIKRTLVVQYWTSRVGEGKSWIEVGVKRGAPGKPSRLGVRWMREGREVRDQEVPLDVGVLSAEQLLKTVIAMHTSHILSTIQTRLRALPMFPASSLHLTTHPSDSFNSSLRLTLTPSRSIRVLIEPITGRFALTRPTAMSIQAEGGMNHDPVMVNEYLVRLKFLVMQEEIESRARSMGWEILKMVNVRREELRLFFPSTTKYMTFMRREGWRREWVVSVALEDGGERFYVSKIHEAPQQWSMSTAILVPITSPLNPSYSFLALLEKVASAIITLHVTDELLTSRNIQHQLKPPKVSDPKLTIPDLYIRFSSLIPRATWGIDALRLTFQALAEDGRSVLTVFGRTLEPMTQLGGEIRAADSDVSFHPLSGSYAIRFTVTVGDTIIDQLVEKLHRIETLIKFVAVIRRFQLPCLHVSLGRIGFRYAKEANSTAEVSFGSEDTEDGVNKEGRGSEGWGGGKMRLHLPPRSPHVRIKHFLENELNTSGLEIVVISLTATLPLLLAFEDIESRLTNLPPPGGGSSKIATTGEGALYVLPRNVDWFRIEYRRHGVVLDWRLRCRKSTPYWYVQDAAAVDAESERGVKGRRKADMLKGIWSGEVEGDWEALKAGAAAGVNGVGGLVRAVHEAIMRAGTTGAGAGMVTTGVNGAGGT